MARMKVLSVAMALVSVALVAGIAYQSEASSEPVSTTTTSPQRLDPALLRAFQTATIAAKRDGFDIVINSGWRSPEYQEHLLQEAIAKYGSREKAARWVATPERSAHVSGDAIDVGPAKAAAWLTTYGWQYGLCRTYKNEPWHFELRASAVTYGCPKMYADPTQDPRMH